MSGQIFLMHHLFIMNFITILNVSKTLIEVKIVLVLRSLMTVSLLNSIHASRITLKEVQSLKSAPFQTLRSISLRLNLKRMYSNFVTRNGMFDIDFILLIYTIIIRWSLDSNWFSSFWQWSLTLSFTCEKPLLAHLNTFFVLIQIPSFCSLQ